MQTSNLIKVVAAFVGGVVVALGSALIYVRATEMMHPQTTVESLAAVQPTRSSPPAPVTDQEASDQAGQTQADQAQADQTAPASGEHQVSSHKPTAAVHSPVVHPKAHRLVASTRVPVRIDSPGQNRLPATPAAEIGQSRPAAAVPAPPVVEGSQSSVPLPQGEPSYTAAGSTPTQPSYAPAPQTQAPYQAPAQYNAPPQSSAPVTEPYQPHVVTLASGTNLVIRLQETLSTDHNYTGDTFRGTLESPIIMDGFIIADRGSKVLGRIANAQKAGRVDGLADLLLTLTEINTTDGQRVRIETSSFDKKGQTSTGEDVAKIAGGAALGAIIGGVAGGGKGAAIGAGAGGAVGTGAVMVTRGKPAVLSTETRLTFHLTSPVTITEKLNN